VVPSVSPTAKIAAAVAAGLAGLALAGPALASESGSGPSAAQFEVQQVLNGQSLQHTFTPAGSMTAATEPLTNPDDLTMLGHDLFVNFQNGVGPQGQPSTPQGNTASTIVEFTADGTVLHQWDLIGKSDGLTADAQLHELIATVNEDANSSIYTISPFAPAGGQVQHYSYNGALPHLGGTDAISVYHGQVLVSASAPATTGTPVTSPAVYSVSFDPSTLVATATPYFNDTDNALIANVGSTFGQVKALALTDPDSNEVVPFLAPRFRGSFMLDSQGDDEQIFARPTPGGGTPGLNLSVLSLNTSVDDSAWVTSFSGFLLGSDSGTDTVDMVSGPLRPGSMFVAATPCSDNLAPGTCPAPPLWPANFLGQENMWTGAISPVTVTGATFNPNSLMFVRG
jgi:hypothetical protein